MSGWVIEQNSLPFTNFHIVSEVKNDSLPNLPEIREAIMDALPVAYNTGEITYPHHPEYRYKLHFILNNGTGIYTKEKLLW